LTATLLAFAIAFMVAGLYVLLFPAELEIKAMGTTEWERECLRWHKRILTGEKAHWCDDWDGLPVDETCTEWPCSCEIKPRDHE